MKVFPVIKAQPNSRKTLFKGKIKDNREVKK